VTVAVDSTHSATTDANGNYTISGLQDGSYTVTPSLNGYTFTPATKQVTISGADVNGTDFTAASSAPQKYNLTVNSGTGSGQYAQGDSVTISANVSSGQIFNAWTGDTQYAADTTAASTTVTMPAQDITLTATFKQAPPNTHSVTGTVTGDVQQGVTITLSNGMSGITDAQGNFTIANVPDGTYTLTPSLSGYTFTPESLSITVNGGDTQVPTITSVLDGDIPDTNNAPVASDDSYSVPHNGTLSVQPESGVLANDIDFDRDELTAAEVNRPSQGTLNLDPSGGFSYTPPSGFTGNVSFRYKAFDGIAYSNVSTVTITVTATSTPAPIAVGDKYTAAQDSVLVTDIAAGLLANDLNASGVTASVEISPSNGTLTLNPDGSFEYQPADDYSGIDTFTYKITDGTNTSTAIVALDVAPIEITIGSILKYKSSQISGLKEDFAKPPKLYGIFENGKKGSFKKMKESTATEFSGAWSKKFTLYNKKDLKSGYDSYYRSKGPDKPVKITVMVKGKTASKSKVDAEVQTVRLVPPVITGITDSSGNTLTEASPGSTITVTGRYFGSKLPKVALELDGRLLKCKVDKSALKYSDYKDKSSAMDALTGKSVIKVILPTKNLPSGSYPLVLNNKIGIATTPGDNGQLPIVKIKE
jgi:hypothetical protein